MTRHASSGRSTRRAWSGRSALQLGLLKVFAAFRSGATFNLVKIASANERRAVAFSSDKRRVNAGTKNARTLCELSSDLSASIMRIIAACERRACFRASPAATGRRPPPRANAETYFRQLNTYFRMYVHTFFYNFFYPLSTERRVFFFFFLVGRSVVSQLTDDGGDSGLVYERLPY